MNRIEQTFREIAGSLPGYEPRPSQVQMVRLVARAIKERGHALIEAGTGSGKSLAYLIPVLQSGRRAVISTGTIALQEQLLQKDIPFVLEAAGLEVSVALAKGRGNYACLRRLEEARQKSAPGSPEQEAAAQLLQLHGSERWSGDRAEIPFRMPAELWREHLGFNAQDCLGRACPNFRFTPHQIARRALADAQLIVANHSLYLADAACGGGLLPEHDLVVFDEAHQLERAAASAFDTMIERGATRDVLDIVRRRYRDLPGDVLTACDALELEVADHLFLEGSGNHRIRHDVKLMELCAAMARVLDECRRWVEVSRPRQMELGEGDPAGQGAEWIETEDAAIAQQTVGMLVDWTARWSRHGEPCDPAIEARWCDNRVDRDQFALHAVPLQVGGLLQDAVWSSKTAILTSATLAADGNFDYIRTELGLPPKTLTAVFDSPFDFPSQTRLYIPQHIPLPNEDGFHEAAAEEVERILRSSRGRAFLLCTSYRSLRLFSALLAGRLPYPVRTQEEMSRSALLAWFRATPSAVLIATSSFWEGVDVAGEALSCVIIDRIPFASPEEPLSQARTELMKQRGENWFGNLVLPRAILMLKQGFGRLIRSREDRGLVAILDRRLITQSYGRGVLNSLPPATLIHELPPVLEQSFHS